MADYAEVVMEQKRSGRHLRAQVDQLKKRSDDVMKSLSEKVVLDGTTYEVWYRQGTTARVNEFETSVHGI